MVDWVEIKVDIKVEWSGRADRFKMRGLQPVLLLLGLCLLYFSPNDLQLDGNDHHFSLIMMTYSCNHALTV